MKKSSRRKTTKHELVTWPNEALKKVAEPVTEFNSELQKLIQDMFYIIRTNNVKGVGLAANQVGVLKRVIVIESEDFKGAMINPELDHDNNMKEKESEGCLSYPGKSIEIERYKTIKVEYFDIMGLRRLQAFEGFTARIIQHEIDHLNGINIIDYE